MTDQSSKNNVSMMLLEVDTVLALIREQQKSASQLQWNCIWPHPWEHYPFQVNGKRKWVRYQDLKYEHKQLISKTLGKVE